MAVVDEEEARGIECRQKQSIGQLGVRIGVFGWWARGRAFAEGMWLRWKDGKGKEHVIRGNEERGRRGYVVEVEGWKREEAYHPWQGGER